MHNTSSKTLPHRHNMRVKKLKGHIGIIWVWKLKATHAYYEIVLSHTQVMMLGSDTLNVPIHMPQLLVLQAQVHASHVRTKPKFGIKPMGSPGLMAMMYIIHDMRSHASTPSLVQNCRITYPRNNLLGFKSRVFNHSWFKSSYKGSINTREYDLPS